MKGKQFEEIYHKFLGQFEACKTNIYEIKSYYNVSSLDLNSIKLEVYVVYSAHRGDITSKYNELHLDIQL